MVPSPDYASLISSVSYGTRRVRPAIRAARVFVQPLEVPKVPSRRDDLAVVLPVFGEVAYETLYWIPYIRKRLHAFRGTVVYFGRDGSEAWSRNIAPRAAAETRINAHEILQRDQVLEHMSALRSKNGSWKQLDRSESSDLYNILIDYACESTGLQRVSVLYPEDMFGLVRNALGDRARAWQAKRAFAHGTMSAGNALPAALFPPRFLTTRFYSKPGLDIPRVMRNGTISSLLTKWNPEGLPILDLTPPELFQDHVGFKAQQPLVTNLFDLVRYSSKQNLAMQSDAIARSERFLGSHGGIGYVAVSLGRPSCLLESEATRINRVHRYFLRRLAAATGADVQQVVVP